VTRFTKLVPALAWAVAGAVAVRRSHGGWGRLVPAATGAPVEQASRAVLAKRDVGGPASPGVDVGPPAQTEEPIPTQSGTEGPGPSSPLGLGPPDWKASVKRAVKEFKDDRGTLTAAGMAFYWFLSLFPSLVAFAGLLSLVKVSDDTIDNIAESVTRALPGGAGEILETAVRNAAERPDGALLAVLFGIAVALWSASAGMVGMQLGLDVAYDVQDGRNFFKKRLVAFELLLAMLVLGGAATTLIVFGAPLGDLLRDNLPFGSAFVVLWTVVRWVGGLIALTGLFATIYYLSPNRETPRWVWVSPGGILAAVIWLVASFGFSIYVNNFATYAETYGTLAGVVVLLLWLYLTAMSVVLGGELNAELERQSAVRKGQVPAEEPA